MHDVPRRKVTVLDPFLNLVIEVKQLGHGGPSARSFIKTFRAPDAFVDRLVIMLGRMLDR